MSIFEKKATAVQGQDPGDTSTSGLGGLISRSELIKKAAERNINPNNTSLQDFESLVVTDPNIIDEGIDISGLRTQTDVSPFLLGNIPDYAGIQYEAFNPRRLSDLMRLYSFGLPVTDTAQIPGAADTLVDVGGGGGQATLPGFDVDSPKNTEADQILNVDTPLTQMITDPVTGQTQTVKQAMTSDAAYTGTPSSPFLASGAAGGASLVRPTTATTTLPSGDVFATDDPMLQEKIDFTPEQQNTLQKILGQAGQTVEGALTQLGKIPGAIVDKFNKTVDVFGKKLNVGKTLAGLAINKVAGAPVSLLFDLLPEGGIAPSTNTARSTGLLQGDNTVTKDKYGISTQTSFDPVQSTINYNEYNVEQVDKLQNRLDELNPDVNPDSKYKTQEDYLKNTKRMRKELEDRKEYLNTINKDPLYGGDVDERDQMLEDISLQNRATAEADAARLRNLTGDVNFEATPTTTTKSVTGIAGPPSIISGPQVDKTPTIKLGPRELGDDFGTLGDDLSAELFGTDTIGDATLLASGDPLGVVTKLQTQKKNVEGIMKSDAYDSLSQEQKDQLQEDLDNINQQLKLKEIEGQTAGLTTMTDATDKIDDFDTTPITTGGPPSIISRPTPTPTPTVPDFISGGGRDRDPDPAPSAPKGPSGPPSVISRPAPAAPVYQDAIMRGQSGGGSDGGGGGSSSSKIVCTMMNESYGFGSFRNKIWLRHSKGLAPEYQKGYHKIFLPLVKLSKKNIVLKKVLEHIAVHRTIDIRQESRGKVHLLGRVYRKILEPICYWVGRHG